MANKVLTYVVKMDIGEGEKKVKDFRVTLKTLEKSEKELNQETQELAKTLSNKLGTSVEASIDKSRTFKSSVRDTARETGKANREVVNISREYDLLASKVGKTEDEQQVLNAQYRLGAGATKAQRDQVERLIVSYQRQRDASLQTQSSMRGLRGQAQNFGYQIQDVAVQAQMGTNALVILGQQGSQLAAGFGATGALIGAGIAITAAAIGAIAPSLMDSKTELDKFNKSLEKTNEIMTLSDGEWEFTESIKEVAKVSQIAAESLKRINIIQLSQQLAKGGSAAVDELEDLTKKWYRLDNYITQSEQLTGKAFSQESRKAFLGLKEASNQLKSVQGEQQIVAYIDALDELQKSFQGELPEETNNFIQQQVRMAASMLQTQKQLAASSKGFEDQAEALEENNDSVNKYIASLSQEIAKLDIAEDKQNEYKASLITSDPAMRQVITNLLDMKDKKEADIDATERATEAQLDYWDALMGGKQSMARTEDPVSDFIKTREQKLDAQYKKDVERVDSYYAMEAISFEQAIAKRDELEQDYLKKKEQFAEQTTDINKSVWEQWAEMSEEALANTDELMFESMDRFISGTADAFASAIVNAEDFGDAMKNVFAGALQSMIAYFAELAIQQALMWAFQSTGKQTAQAGAAAMQATQNEAVAVQAGLNALTSMAGAPFPLNLGAPAFSAATFAAAQGLAATSSGLWAASAAVPTFDKGGFIPAGGAGIVSEFGDELVGGTMVYNGSPNSLKVTGREDTARMTGGGGGNQYFTVNSNGNASPDAIARAIARTLKKPNKQVDNAVYGSMNRGRKNGGKRFA